MPRRSVHLDQHLDSLIGAGLQQEDKAKLEWLRRAVQEGIDSLDRGTGLAFHSMDELADHIRGIGRDLRQKLSAD